MKSVRFSDQPVLFPLYCKDFGRAKPFEDLITSYVEPVGDESSMERVKEKLKILDKYCKIFGNAQIIVKWPNFSTNRIALVPRGKKLPKIRIYSNRDDLSILHTIDKSKGNYFKITIHEDACDTDFLIGNVESEALNNLFAII